MTPSHPPESLSSLSALDHFQSRAQYCFHTEEFADLTARATSRATLSALLRLQAEGRVRRIGRGSGYWLVVPPDHKPTPPVSWWLHDYLSQREEFYYAGLLTAAQVHGSAHYAPMETEIFLPAQRRALVVGPIRVRFFYKAAAATTPCVTVPTEKSKLRVSSIASTLLDLLRHASAVGGIDRIANIFSDLKGNIYTDDLKSALNAANDISSAQRLGYLFELHGKAAMAATVEKWLRAHRMQTVRLDTSTPSDSGEPKRSPRWNLVLNNALEETN